MNNPEVTGSGQVLLERANSFVKELARSEDNSAALFDQRTTQRVLCRRKICCESAAVCEIAVDEWKGLKLREILAIEVYLVKFTFQTRQGSFGKRSVMAL